MESPRDELFQRYYDAAGAISTPSACHREAAGARSGDSPAEDTNALTGPMEELLCRQARLLQTMHRTQRGDAADGPPVDDALVFQRLDDLASIVVSRFYAYRYDRVPDFWRYLYTDILVLMSYSHLLRLHDAEGDSQPQHLWSLLVESLDRALITSGGQSRHLGQRWIEETMSLLGSVLQQETDQRPSKRQKMSDATISLAEPYGRPQLSPTRECPRNQGWSLDEFENYMNRTGAPKPVVFTDLIGDWPALTDRPWQSVDYLLSQTLGGRRLVPVEVGRSYVDEDWGQELIPVKSFLDKYVLAQPQQQPPQPGEHHHQVGYLAQHNLFRQIPPLRNDMRIPDFCWADVPGHPSDPSKGQPALDTPQLNAWFGPARTITPLHTDGYHNLLCQVVGHKYVRLYPPSATPAMRPRGMEQGVDMSNTGGVDVGVVEGWDPVGEDADEEEAVGRMREELEGVEYWECILGPGDTLLIPLGWWHYVRSLSVSFSVSFWWN